MRRPLHVRKESTEEENKINNKQGRNAQDLRFVDLENLFLQPEAKY